MTASIRLSFSLTRQQKRSLDRVLKRRGTPSLQQPKARVERR